MDGRTNPAALFRGVLGTIRTTCLMTFDRIEKVISGPRRDALGSQRRERRDQHPHLEEARRTPRGSTSRRAGAQGLWRTSPRCATGGLLAPDVYYRIYAKYFPGATRSYGWRKGDRLVAPEPCELPRRRGGKLPLPPSALRGDAYSGSENEITGGDGQGPGRQCPWALVARIREWLEHEPQAYYGYTSTTSSLSSWAPSSWRRRGILTDGLDTYDVEFSVPHEPRGEEPRGLRPRLLHHDVLQNAPALAFLPPTLNQSLSQRSLEDRIMIASELFLTFSSKVEQ